MGQFHQRVNQLERLTNKINKTHSHPNKHRNRHQSEMEFFSPFESHFNSHFEPHFGTRFDFYPHPSHHPFGSHNFPFGRGRGIF
jgi:hypothetical protein